MKQSAIYQRVDTMLQRIKEKQICFRAAQHGLRYMETAYKAGSHCPELNDSNSALFEREAFWGGTPDTHAWFYKQVAIPVPASGLRYELELRTDVGNRGDDILVDEDRSEPWDASNPQFILYYDGKAIQGLDVNHISACLPADKAEVNVHIYAYTGTNLQPSTPLKLHMDVVGIDEDCEKLYYDLKVPADVLAFTGENTRQYHEILGYLNGALNLLDWRSEDKFRKSCKAASDYLEQEFYGKYCTKGNVQVKCIGHTHIDIGWLWTVRQTKEKAQRSFFTVLELMRRYPDYKFMSSQVPLYQAIKEEAPDQYEEIKQRIREGRWEVEGAMWVEADCVLTSGESLVRQLLYGKRFFKEEFGIDSRVLWLPDVFGYSAAMPQILRKCGVDKFVTSKISWNDTNTMPDDTFTWKGMDGSEIFTYFMTAQEMHRDEKLVNFTTYLPQANASYVMGAWNRYQNKDISDEAILTFGFGDGGGGPTARDLEMLRRMEHGIPGCPTTKIQTAGEFLDSVEEKTRGKLPSWTGELYFEYHRGIYTSQAEIKKNNRKAEFALHNFELIAATANRLLGTEYPHEELRKLWQTVLVNQFHDILPGSSIQEIYQVANAEYEAVLARCKQMTDHLLQKLSELCAGSMVYNPTPFTVGGTVQADGITRYVDAVPANGFAAKEPVPMDGSVLVSDRKMENKFFLLELDDAMNICRLYDKRSCREVLPKGKTANRLCLYEDFPHNFDAWEIRSYHKEKGYPIDAYDKAEQVLDGERSGLKITRSFGTSKLVQTIWLYEHIDRIDVDSVADWHEKHHMLKVAFPVDVNTDKATFDIQFGNYERSALNNTSWQQAQFEVSAQKFADLSDSGYGLAVLNDCKYGHSAKEGEITLTLLRAPTYPDPDCDMGVHTFTYALYPHDNDLRHSKVYEQAYLLNNPMLCVGGTGKGTKTAFSAVKADKDNIIIETVKLAEDSDSCIVRLFESMNRQTTVTLQFGFPVNQVQTADMLENPMEELTAEQNAVTLTVKPFEIITLKIQ